MARPVDTGASASAGASASGRSTRGRRRRLLAGVLVFVAVALLTGFWLHASNLFAVDRVIVGQTHYVSDGQIRSALDPARGRNLLRVSPDALERQLRALPFMRAAEVYRRFPHALEVRVTEYRPAAVVRGRDRRSWLAAADGRVLAPVQAQTATHTAEAEEGLLFVVPVAETWPQPGAQLPVRVVEALQLVPLLQDRTLWPAKYRVERLDVALDGSCVLVLAGGLELRLGRPTALKEKLTVAGPFIDPELRHARTLRFIDVRNYRKVVCSPIGS
jgi:hypothetical protein